MDEIENLGRVFIETTSYHNINRHIVDKVFFTQFKIYKGNQRIKYNIIVLTDQDIIFLSSKDPKKVVNDKFNLISLFRETIRMANNIRSDLYNNINFRVDDVSRSIPFPTVIRNRRIKRIISETDNSFLEQAVHLNKSVIKVVRKIIGLFAIISIFKNDRRQRIMIKLYFPTLKREFVAFLYAGDMTETDVVLEEVMQKAASTVKRESFGDILKSNQNNSSDKDKPRGYINYLRMLYTTMAEIKYENSQLATSYKQNTSVNQNDISSFAILHSRLNYKEDIHQSILGWNNEIDKDNNFYTQFFWETLLSTVKIEKKALDKYVLNVGNCSSILKETVFMSDITINGELFYIEILIENTKQFQSVFSSFGNYRLENLDGIFFFLKYINLSKGEERNDRVGLLKAIRILELDFQGGDQINIQKIKQVGFKLAQKMFEGLKRFYRDKKKENLYLETNITYLIAPTKNSYINLHSRICSQLQLSESDNFILLYKTRFTQKPLQICCIFFHTEKKQFMILIYNLEARGFAKIELQMNHVMRFLPFTKICLKNREFFNTGKRIYNCFKNTMLVRYKVGVYQKSSELSFMLTNSIPDFDEGGPKAVFSKTLLNHVRKNNKEKVSNFKKKFTTRKNTNQIRRLNKKLTLKLDDPETPRSYQKTFW